MGIEYPCQGFLENPSCFRKSVRVEATLNNAEERPGVTNSQLGVESFFCFVFISNFSERHANFFFVVGVA